MAVPMEMDKVRDGAFGPECASRLSTDWVNK